MFKHIKINFDFDEILNADYLDNKLSSMHSKIMNEETVFPSSYNESNTSIYQRWWTDNELDFVDIGNQLDMEVATISSILLPPGNVIPWHTDTFVKLKNIYPDRNDFVRAMIYATDYVPGQVTQIKNGTKYETYSFWNQGEGYLIDESIPHVNVNGSFKPVVTLNVSGVLLH